MEPIPYQHLFDQQIAIDQLVWIGGILSSPSHAFTDFLSEVEDGDELNEVFNLGVFETDENLDYAEGILETLMDKGCLGFLVRATTPCPMEGTIDVTGNEVASYASSWGCTWGKWFYFPALDMDMANALTDWKCKSVLEVAKREGLL